MPSIQKTLHFMSSALVTSLSIGAIGYGMSTQWATSTMECARGGSGFFNGTAVIILDLFDGNLNRAFCPSFGTTHDFEGNLKGPVHPKYKTTYFLNVPPYNLTVYADVDVLVLFSQVFEIMSLRCLPPPNSTEIFYLNNSTSVCLSRTSVPVKLDNLNYTLGTVFV